VPTDSSVFMEIFIDIVTSVDFRNSSFIDIGCGVPILSDFMKQTGCKDSSGLEYNTKLINEVKDDYPNLKLYTEDMLKYQEYGKYDILYSYNPLCNSKKMDDALFLIIEQMKIGAVFYFSPAAVSLDFKEWGFEAPSNIH
jgi:trans-aconitate methyltransferase